MNDNKLTKWEWAGLSKGHNIADGHAHQPQDQQIIKHAYDLMVKAEASNQHTIQKEFEQAFFTANGQKSYTKLNPPLYQSACSLSIEAVANYLRAEKKSVAMLHPTFDNLADILKRHNIPLTAINESQLINPLKNLAHIKSDAIFLVLPNNPTGLEITKKQFLDIIKYCKENNKLLILDHSFRFYSSYTTWDQYEYLYSSGIEFIIFEDTGKTWPTLELKIGITLASNSLYPHLKDITNDFLLNVSPFNFLLITEYIKSNALTKALQNVEANRQFLRKHLAKTALKIVNKNSKLSVEWLELPSKWKGTAFCKWLGDQGIHVLPGNPFFWNDHNSGESFIRIALQRPRQQFSSAIHQLKDILSNYEIPSRIK